MTVVALVVAVVGCGRSGSTPHAVAPPVAGWFDYQIGGAYPPAPGVRIVDRDRSDPPVPGRYDICYVNAFQSQAEEAGWWKRHHPGLLLHARSDRLVSDPGWPGEYVLDTSTEARRRSLAAIVGGWIDGCGAKGYDAVELDNLDSWTRSGVDGRLTMADAVAFAELLVTRAHRDGLTVAQKNTSELAPIGPTRIGFDFAIVEECQVYEECAAFTRAYGRHVIEIEYTDDGRAAYRRACALRAGRISIILRDRNVVPAGDPAYHSQHC